MSDGKYSVLSEDTSDSELSRSPEHMAEMFKLFCNLYESKPKKNKKGGKKYKKYKKYKKSHKVSNKKNKKSKKKSKNKNMFKNEQQYRLLEIMVEKSLDTASYSIKRYFDHKWPI